MKFPILDALGKEIHAWNVLLYVPEKGKLRVVIPSTTQFNEDGTFCLSGHVYPGHHIVTIEGTTNGPNKHIYVLGVDIGDLM